MQLTVEQVTKSKSGKALRVKANGAWYGARLTSKLDTVVGKVIEAEVKHDETYGDQIEAYQVVNINAAPQSAEPAGKASGVVAQTPAGAAPIWSNFVSNQVAHAIQAGLIQSPEQVKVWAAASKTAFLELLQS